MRRGIAIKSMLCVGIVSILAAGPSAVDLGATGICAETSLAGISLSLEKYIEKTDNNKVSTMASSTQGTGLILGDTPLVGDVTAVADIETAAAAIEEPSEIPAEPVPEETPTPSKYENMGISIANDYVNIRSNADTESEVLGKLYRGAAATIIETTGDWVKIKSGKVEGYIKKEFLAIGFDAEELEDLFGTKWATVNTTTLKVREKKSTDATVMELIPLGETYEVIKEYDDWVKILVDEGGDGDEGTKGYVHKDYVDITVEFQHAISVEEEQEQLRREEEAKKAEEERLKALEEQQKRAQEKAAQDKKNNSSNSNKSSSSNSSSNNSSSSANNASDKSVESGDGSEIAAYAQKFVGNPYVYGGTSLTNGADCSGFTYSVFSHFGVSIPRTSSSQSGAGRKVSFDELRAGDLIFYAKNGSVNHVALYIGGGQVVHASNRKTGIKISAWNYRSPYTARRVVE